MGSDIPVPRFLLADARRDDSDRTSLDHERMSTDAVPAPEPPLATTSGVGADARAGRHPGLVRHLILLSAPIAVEQTLHMLVGLTDVYLAGHLAEHATDATAAIGVIAYMTWLVGLVAGAIGTGATAIIARATGARHRSLANSVCGQSVGAALLIGGALAALGLAFADDVVQWTGFTGRA